MRTVSLLFLILFGCSNFKKDRFDESPSLFKFGRQKHTVSVYGDNSKLLSQSVNIVELSEQSATLVSLSPAFTTLMRATLYPEKKARVDFLGASLADRKQLVVALLKKLSEILWIKQGELSSDLKILAVTTSGFVKKLEWQLGDKKVFIEVTPL